MPTAKPEIFVDPYMHCEGIDFSKLGLTTTQVSRIHKLYKRQGRGITSCTHDLGVGVTLEQLKGGDGKYQGNNALWPGGGLLR
jgi:hypothetical protein